MSGLVSRIKTNLEPILELADPRERISAYHDMPYALFRYEPEEEFELRKQISLLETRLTQKGKRVSRISLAQCLDEAMRSQRPLEDWFAAEREQGTDTIVETVHSVLSEYAPLVDLVAAKMPDDPDPLRDIVFIMRTGALFPVYRTFSLLEQLKGRVAVPAVLFYPGDLDGAAGLRFMGVLAAEHNYRPQNLLTGSQLWPTNLSRAYFRTTSIAGLRKSSRSIRPPMISCAMKLMSML